MILPFSTVLNGKPTYFVEKIWLSFSYYKIFKEEVYLYEKHNYRIEHYSKFQKDWDYCYDEPTLKLHTIREDKNNRWQTGIMIDFFINSRTKDMFRFAPRVPVVSVQNIEIIWKIKAIDAFQGMTKSVEVIIDGHSVDEKNIFKLAKCDGFANPKDFFNYFNQDFKGKIIHWTDLKY